MQGLFVTGTDTGVGKTHTACGLIRAAQAAGIRVGAYKPVCSGAVTDSGGQPRWEDVDALFGALDGAYPAERISPQRFLAPLAPPVAAQVEGRLVDYVAALGGVDWWRSRVDLLIVEGAGGLLCPLSGNRTMADLAVDLAFPVVVVAANRLGTINHTLLTLEALQHRYLRCKLVVLSDVTPEPDASAARNADILQTQAADRLLGSLAHGSTLIQTRRGPLTGLDLMQLAQNQVV